MTQRRGLLLAPLLLSIAGRAAKASPINSMETFVRQRPDINFVPWAGLPPGSGEMAKLYGDFDKPGPYLVLMKWLRAGSVRRTVMPLTASKWHSRALGGSTAAPTSHHTRQIKLPREASSNVPRAHTTMTVCRAAPVNL
jgi:hypothetical protein